MFGVFRASALRARRLRLSLEILEDRLVLAGSTGWADPLTAAVASRYTKVAASSSALPSSQPAADSYNGGNAYAYGDQSSSGDQGDAGDSYRSAAGQTAAGTYSNSPTGKGGDSYTSNASYATYSDAGSGQSSGQQAAGNSTSGVTTARASDLTAGSTASTPQASAYYYYGSQPYYRIPVDSTLAYRTPQAPTLEKNASQTETVAATLPADQAKAAAPAHSPFEVNDPASRARNADVAAAGMDRQQPVGRGFTEFSQPQNRPDLVPVADAPGNVERVPAEGTPAAGSSLLLAELVPAGQVAVGLLPFDLGDLERGVEQFFGQIATLGDHVTHLEAVQRLAPWLVAVALSTAALETVRWRFRKPVPCQPVLTVGTRVLATGFPGGAEPLPPVAS
jgi:hypothetical protein